MMTSRRRRCCCYPHGRLALFATWLLATTVVHQHHHHHDNTFPPSVTYYQFPTLTTIGVASAAAASPSSPCTICVNGDDGTFVNTTKSFTVAGLPVNTCGDLLPVVGIFVQSDAICQSIQTIGTYCGCPRFPQSCTLCDNGTSPSHPLLLLSNYNASQYVYGAPEGVKLNCETLDHVLNVLANSTSDALCVQARHDVAATCGCPSNSHNNTNNSSSNNIFQHNNNTTPAPAPSSPTNTISSTTTTTHSNNNNNKPCSVCLDSTITPPFPNRTLSLGNLPVHNCHDLTLFAHLLQAQDAQCQGLQSLGPYCGCPFPPGSCTLCANGQRVQDPFQPAPLLEDFRGLPSNSLAEQLSSNLTCGVFESAVAIPPPPSVGFGVDPSLFCLIAQFRSGVCGCSHGYKAIMITWFYRCSALLSLAGACSIVWNILQKPPERRTTYHQLVFGISSFDILTAISYILTGVALPASSGQYQAKGTHATCLVQGFMIQLGQTSMFYNVLLCVYFLLLVKYNWKEHRFHKYRNWLFHLPILLVGLGLAGGCIPYLVPQLGFCYIAIPPEYPNRIPISMFFAIPTSLSLLCMITCSFRMCYFVFMTERTSLRYSGTKQNLALTKKVCWQSLFYCGIFVVTLPLLMTNYYVNFEGGNSAFWQFSVSALLAPSQGFLNSLIYFQRAHSFQRCVMSWFCCWWCPRMSSSSSSSSSRKDSRPFKSNNNNNDNNTADGQTDKSTCMGDDGKPRPERSVLVVTQSPSQEDFYDDEVMAVQLEGRSEGEGQDDSSSSVLLHKDDNDDDLDDIFSASAAHWLNEQLSFHHNTSSSSRRSSMLSQMSLPRFSMHNLFRRHDSTLSPSREQQQQQQQNSSNSNGPTTTTSQLQTERRSASERAAVAAKHGDTTLRKSKSLECKRVRPEAVQQQCHQQPQEEEDEEEEEEDRAASAPGLTEPTLFIDQTLM